jgi:predicted nucleotidyltransferase component of viral defense system
VKTSTQLNVLVRNLAKEKNVGAEIILRNYMLERLLERIALSDYRNNFILKGGMLIAAMVGLDTRTTMDLDATLRGQDLTESQVAGLFREILEVQIDDNVNFTFKKITEIREEAEYPGYRVSFEARLDNTRQTLKVDISTGDLITPREIEYQFKLMFENRTIGVLAYNLETVLAEKLESIIVRGETNTRMRDFYDVYILTQTQDRNIDRELFRKALHNTADRRGTLSHLEKSGEVVKELANSQIMLALWTQYQKNYPYADDLTWGMAVKAVKELCGQEVPQQSGQSPKKKKPKDRGGRDAR